MAKFKRLALTELGETTDSYDWTVSSRHSDGWTFTFFTENYEYTVFFQRHGEWLYSGFDVEEEDESFAITNEGNHFKVVATIMDMARHVWKNRNRIDADVRGFSFDAGEVRTKLYKRFIFTQFPDAEVNKVGYEIKVEP